MKGKQMENPELEAAIIANPENTAAWAAYANWLQSQEDPRGELIALELAQGADTERNQQRRARIGELYKDNGETWAPGFPHRIENQKEIEEWEWKYGYVNVLSLSLSIPNSRDSDSGELTPLSVTEILENIETQLNTLEKLLTPTTLKFLQRLDFYLNGEPYAAQQVLQRLRKFPFIKSLRDMRFTFMLLDENEDCISNFFNIAETAPSLSNLYVLNAFTEPDYDTPYFGHANLKTLTIDQSGRQIRALEFIARIHLPALKELTLVFDSVKDLDKDQFWRAFAYFFNKKGLPQLKELKLQLEPARAIQEFITLFAGTRLLKNLDKLTLSGGKLDNKGAAVFLQNCAFYEHLKQIQFQNPLNDSRLKAEIQETLKGKTLVIFGNK